MNRYDNFGYEMDESDIPEKAYEYLTPREVM